RGPGVRLAATGERAGHAPPLRRSMVADGSAERRIARLERVQDGPLRGAAVDVQGDLAVDAGEGPQVLRHRNANHDSVCASTESTDGRSCTIAVQLSPPSADAYTWPPLVPK